MNNKFKKYICPCCGYNKLEFRPYEIDIVFPLDTKISIPYSKHFGGPSYGICDCFGYEYGNDDEPGTSEGVTFSQYLKKWINDGCNWFNPAKKPEYWDLKEQLHNAKIEIH